MDKQRKVFNINVGNMSPEQAVFFLKGFKAGVRAGTGG